AIVSPNYSILELRMQPSSQDWVGKPANVKLHPSLSSGVVALVLGVPRLVKVAVERDADCALLSVPKVLVIRGNGSRVAHDESLADDPGLRGAVALGALLVCAASPGGVAAGR